MASGGTSIVEDRKNRTGSQTSKTYRNVERTLKACVEKLNTASRQPSRSLVIFLALAAAAVVAAAAEKTVTATTQSDLCSYTLVVHEFDVSQCSAHKSEYTLADGADRLRPHDDAPSTYVHPASGDRRGHGSRSARAHSPGGSKQKSGGGGGAGATEEDGDSPALSSLVQDVENKLLEEMVRNRALNTTLARHEALLKEARDTLESYRSNFTSVFYQMMQVERKLHRQRRINRSLNKKLSNVILDVVEVNNVISNKLPASAASGGGGTATGKHFAVESSSAIRACPGISNSSKQHQDCASVFSAGHHRSGVYYIKPLYTACPIPVWCDMDSPGGGWLLLQRRRNGRQNFNRDWEAYRAGFGDVGGEHWLGNDNIFLLTNQGRYQLRIDLWDFSGNRVHALYSNFKVDGERDQYRLHVSGYSGSAQDSLHRHNQKKFSTPDRDNDSRGEASCAQEWEAGWWFDNCWFALLNGPYHNRSDVSWRGLAWNHWKREQLRASEMKIRPVARRRRS